MFQMIRTAATLLAFLTVLTGLVYPLMVTAIAQVVFPRLANGSLLEVQQTNQRPLSGEGINHPQSQSDSVTPWVGSELIGQAFTNPKYLWSRPSATAPVAYNGMGGSGSNQAATNPALLEAVRERIDRLRAADPENQSPVPVDLVTASASGLDPHISHAAALFQRDRVARARHCDPSVIDQLLESHVEGPTFGVFGQTRVNVLKLNLALDAFFSKSGSQAAEEHKGL